MRFHGINWLRFIGAPVKLKIIRFLCRNKADLSEREIASIVKVSHMSVNRLLRDLAKVNFAYPAVIGGSHVWHINREGYAFKVLSSLIDTKAIFDEPLEDLKKVVLGTLPLDLVSKLVLFGSISVGVEKENSDIDLFIVVKNQEAKDSMDTWLNKLSTKCLEFYGNRFAPYILTQNEFMQKKDLEVIKNIKKGIEIYPLKKEPENVA